MNWDDDSFPDTVLEENMVASLDSGQRPTLIRQQAAKVFSRNLLQTANTRSWEFLSEVRPEGSVSR